MLPLRMGLQRTYFLHLRLPHYYSFAKHLLDLCKSIFKYLKNARSSLKGVFAKNKRGSGNIRWGLLLML